MTALIAERAIDCQSDVCSLWNVLTDTERMNRAVGMEPVEFAPLKGPGAARFVGTTNLGGFDVEYEERPFEWEYLRRFRVERRMRTGPAAAVDFSFAFEPIKESDGTRVRVRLAIEPRISLLSPFMRLSASRQLRKFEAEVRKIDEALKKGGPPPSLRRRGLVDEDAIRRLTARLRETEPAAIVDKLETLVRDGADFDVGRMRPFALADEWGLDRREVLSTMLHAVRAGLLELRWEMVCPSCRVASDAVPTLSALKDHGSCQLCEVDFGLDVDEAVEATFCPTSGVREIDKGPYCIGGPARVPHVITQAILPARGQATLTAPSEPGRYRVFVRGGAAAQLALDDAGPREVAIDGPSLTEGEVVTVAPGAKVVVKNPGSDERHAKIERSTWATQAATAREVTALPAFRRDFSSDVLKPGASLKVSHVTLFFSDLTASTQLYSNVGDAAAFRLVQDHFDVVLSILETHHGSLVKTIGDAVMAVFASDLDAVAASMAVLREFEKFRKNHPHREQTHIKLGLHGGACYVVTANGILDYFGQTVNIAARLQAQADSGELVVDEELGERAIAKGIVDPSEVAERYSAKLKGVDSEVRVMRIVAVRAPASAPVASASSGMMA